MDTLFRKIMLGFGVFVLILVLIEGTYKVFTFKHNKTETNNKTEIANPKEVNDTNKTTVNKPIIISNTNGDISKDELTMKISNFIDLITYKKYQKAYDLLAPDFKALYYPSLQKFADLNSGLYKNDKVVLIQYFDNTKENQYVCKVRIQDYGVLPEEINSNSSGPIEGFFTVNIISEDKYSIAQYGYIGSQTTNCYTKTGEIGLKIARIDRYYNKANVELEVLNNESTPVTIIDGNSAEPLNNIKLSTMEGTNGPQSTGLFFEGDFIPDWLKNPIASGKSAKISLQFNVLYNQSLSKISFDNIKVGEEVRNVEIEMR